MSQFKKLYLHLGLEKTGTTSIQKALNQHRDQLERLGYYYPRQFAVGLNTLLAAMFVTDPMDRPNFRIYINKHGGTQDKHIQAMNIQLSKELETVKTDNLLLSSEFLATDTDFPKLKNWCDQLAYETQIIIYIREQCSFYLSRQSTMIKGGGTKDDAIILKSKRDLPSSMNFKAVLSRLETAFPGKISVRIFNKDILFRGDAIQDFFKTIGLGDLGANFTLPRANESLSLIGTEFLLLANQQIPLEREGQRNLARDQMIHDMGVLDSGSEFGKNTLSSEEVDVIQAMFKDGNEAVRAKYFPEMKTLFPAYQPGDQGSVSKDDVFKYSVKLLEKAYTALYRKQALLNEIAPYLNRLSKDEKFGDEIQTLIKLNKKIHKDRDS